MNMAKTHTDKIEFIKNLLEEDYQYKCQKELHLPIQELGSIHRLDLGCFGKCRIPIAVEIDTKFDSPQARSNLQDLERFKELFPNAKTFHLNTNEHLTKEDLADINTCQNLIIKEEKKTEERTKIKWLGPFNFDKK